MNSPTNLRYVVRVAFTAALGGLLFGFDIAIISGAGPFLLRYFQLSDLSLGWAFSCLLFGCILGSALAGRLADLYGRRTLLRWVAVLFAVTSVATGLAPSFTTFVIARFLAGIAVGVASLVSPMYVAEVSPPRLRGRLCTLYQLSIVTGILVSYCVNYLFRDLGPNNWRWMFATGLIPSCVLLLFLLGAPETPRFLCLAGRHEQALAILKRIAGPDLANAEIEEIQSSLGRHRPGWRALLAPTLRRPLWVGFFLAILIHVSGINTVIDYAPAILHAAGFRIDTALLSTFVIGLTNFALTIVSFWMIDRFGRRALYIVGSLGMTGALLVLTTVAFTGRFQGAIVLPTLLAYLGFFSACVGPVFWTLVPEMFPNHVRGTAMTVPVLTQWVANAFVVLLFPFAFNHIGKAATFGFLAAMALAQALFTWLFVPETGSKRLEEMEKVWLATGVGTAAVASND